MITIIPKITWMSMFFGLVAHTIFAQEAKQLRLGHFPNITHAQAIIAHATGEFEKAIGVPVQWTLFNAGPAAIEALFANEIDAVYLGPNPAINGYVKTHGDVFCIVAGSASGGAALVVRSDAGITNEKDFNDKIVATPQLGNTQDVAARIWFKQNGYKVKEKGGRLTLLTLANPNQLLMFQKKEIDAAWTIEPWVSCLELEANGKILLNEKTLWPNRRYVTTHLIVSRKFLEKNRTLIKKLLQAHVETTQKLNANKASAVHILSIELKRETGKKIPENIIHSALNRVEFTWDPIPTSLFKAAEDAYQIGFLREHPHLESIYDLSLLNEILREKKLPPVK